MDKQQAYDGTIELFSAIIVDNNHTKNNRDIDDAVNLAMTAINSGVYLDPKIILNIANDEIKTIIGIASIMYGVSNKELNSTFFKDFETVNNKSELELLIRQLIYYATNYGFVDVSEIEDSNKLQNKLKYIKAISKNEFREEALKLLSSSVALHGDDIYTIVSLMNYYGIGNLTNREIESITNKEAKMYIYEYLNKTPDDPVEFLRYNIFMLTGSTLLIKSNEAIQDIKYCVELQPKGCKLVKQFKDYDKIKLAKIFNRFKPIFLALKETPELKSDINKISKLSKKHHVPYKEPVMASLTTFEYDTDVVEKAVSKAPMSQIIRAHGVLLEYAHMSLKQEQALKLYNVRNGKTFFKIKEYIPDFSNINKALKYIHIIEDEIAKRLVPYMDNATVVLNKNINFTIPTSMKKLIGNVFPNYTTISLDNLGKDDDLIIGITWDKGVDIDLSASIVGEGSVAWNTRLSSVTGVTHSGDMIRLNNHGFATEFILIESGVNKPVTISDILYSSMYAKMNNDKYKLVIAKRSKDDILSLDYKKDFKKVTDIGDVLFVGELEMSNQSKTLGVYMPDTKSFIITDTKFGAYNRGEQGNITDYQMGELINESIKNDAMHKMSFEYLISVLGVYGATINVVFDEKNIPDDCDNVIDLRPENININTFVDILNK